MRRIRLSFTLDEIDERGLNARDGHWSDRSAAEASIHMVVAQRVRRKAPRIRLGLVDIRVTRRQTTMRRRDPDNLAATAKPMIDGLVQAGLIPDDGHRHVREVVLRVKAGAGSDGWDLDVIEVQHDREEAA